MNYEIGNKLTVDDYLFLIKSVGWKELNPNQVRRGLKNSMYIVTVRKQDKIIGMARLVGDYGCHSLLTDVIVLEEHRNQGLGQMIIKEILKRAYDDLNENGKLLIELCPTAGKREFYLKCGFKYKPENIDGMYLWLEK